MAELWTNVALSTLASDLTSGATSLTLASGQGALFPAPTGGDYFWLSLEAGPRYNPTAYEIVQVTARSGDVLTIVRAQQGTSAQAFSTGDRAELHVTQRTLEDLRDRLIARSRHLPPAGYVGGNAVSTNIDPWGLGPTISTGPTTSPTLATTNQLTGTGRARRQGSATAGFRSTGTSQVWRGDAAGLGGFLWTFRFGQASNNSSTSLFCGLYDLDSYLLDSGSPSSLTTRQFVGVGFDTSSGTTSNYVIFHNDGSGGAVGQVDSGIQRTTSACILVQLSAEPNGSSIVVLVRNQSTGTSITSTLTSNLPASTTFLYHQLSIRGNGGANTGQIDIPESEYRNLVAT